MVARLVRMGVVEFRLYASFSGLSDRASWLWLFRIYMSAMVFHRQCVSVRGLADKAEVPSSSLGARTSSKSR